MLSSSKTPDYKYIITFIIFLGYFSFAQINSERIRHLSRYQIPAHHLSETSNLSNIQINGLISNGEQIYIGGEYQDDTAPGGWLARLADHSSWQPTLTNVWTSSEKRFQEMTFYGSHGFAAFTNDDGHSIASVNLMQHDSPFPFHEENSTPSPSAASHLWSSGNQLFVSQTSTAEYLYVYDIGIHGRISYHGKLTENRLAGALAGNADYLLVAATETNQADDPQYIRIYHQTDSLPQYIATYDQLDSVKDMVLSDTLVYVADESMLRVLLFSDSSLSEVATVTDVTALQRFYIADNLLYLLTDNSIEVFDISSTIPSRIAWHPVSDGRVITVLNDKIYVTTASDIIDIYELRPADHSFTTDRIWIEFPTATSIDPETVQLTFINNGTRRVSFGQLKVSSDDIGIDNDSFHLAAGQEITVNLSAVVVNDQLGPHFLSYNHYVDDIAGSDTIAITGGYVNGTVQFSHMVDPKSFEAVFPGDTAYAEIQLALSENDSDLVISHYRSQNNRFFVPDLAKQIAPDSPADHVLRVGFVPDSNGESVDTLELIHNYGADTPLKFILRGIGVDERVTFSADTVHFADTFLGISTAASVMLTNETTQPLVVDTAMAADPNFTVEFLPFTLAANRDTTLALAFRPSEEGTWKSAIQFYFNQSATPTNLPVRGTANAYPASNVQVISGLQNGDIIIDIAAEEDTIYTLTADGRFQAYDARIAGAPLLLSEIALGPNKRFMEKLDDWFYVGSDPGGIQVVEVLEAAAPEALGSLDTPGQLSKLFFSGQYAYLADGSGVHLLPTVNPRWLVLQSTWLTPGSASGVIVVDDFLYIADGDSGLRVIDYTNFFSPVEAGYLKPAAAVKDIVGAGNYGYALLADQSIIALDLSIRSAPQIVSTFQTPGNPLGLKLDGSRLYVADDDAGLRVTDVADPAAPEEIGFFDSPGKATSVRAAGDQIYLADDSGGWFSLQFGNFTAIETPGTPEYTPEEFALLQNFPNPFNPSTTIRFELPRAADLRLTIYNTLGEVVRLAVNGRYSAGLHSFVWDGRNDNGQQVASGVYLLQMQAAEQVLTRKMVLLK